ncbi:hypothetical protein ACQ858_20510 [Variovorax ureilyticus]
MTASFEPARRRPGPHDAGALLALAAFVSCDGFTAWTAALHL